MYKILIVDDSAFLAHAHGSMLEAQGMEVIYANNGEVGILKAKMHKPDLILMDLVMPNMNGFQATRKLSQDPDTSGIPVIIITTKDQETDKIWGMRQGAVEYLVKPINENDLVAKINAVMAA